MVQAAGSAHSSAMAKVRLGAAGSVRSNRLSVGERPGSVAISAERELLSLCAPRNHTGIEMQGSISFRG